MKQTLAFVIAGITLVLAGAGAHLAGGDAQVYASDPPGTDASFEVDVDTTAGGIQTTRVVTVGTSFNIEVSTNTTNSLPWEAYQITLDYTDPILDAVGPASAWDIAVSEGVNGGTVFGFTTGAFCTPSTQSTSIFNEDDSASAQWAMTCTELTSDTNHTGEGALVQFTFTCEQNGIADLTLAAIADTFLLDAAFSQFNEHVHNAQVTCGTGTNPTDTPTNTPTLTNTPGAGVPTATPVDTATLTPTPTHTRTPGPDDVQITPTPRTGATGGQTPTGPGGATPTRTGGSGGQIGGPDTGAGTGSGGGGSPLSATLLAAGAVLLALGLACGTRGLVTRRSGTRGG